MATLPAGHGRVAYHLALVTETEQRLLAAQRALIESWITSSDPRTTASRYLRWRNLNVDPNEVCNEAWMRLTASLDRRTEPLPAVTSSADAGAYCARVIDNLVRDRRRIALRTEADPLEGIPELALPSAANTDRVLDRVMVEQLLHLVAHRGTSGITCDGCPATVVVATALEVLHMVLAGDDGGDRGRDWFDRIVHTALSRVDEAERNERAQDQRKSRCGRCVIDVLAAAMCDITGGEV